VFADRRSPIAYGYDAQLPVYFNQEPVLNIVQGGARGAAPEIPGVGMVITPMATANNRLSSYDPESAAEPAAPPSARRGAQGGRGETVGGGRGGAGTAIIAESPRVILAFPSSPDDMLLSGVLVGGEALANRAQVVDIPLGQGHVVSFAIRPFWRWQTQGTFFLGFNTILNWNDLDAGRAATRPTTSQ
jgi:hypothetical protein